MAKGKGEIQGWITKNGVHIPIYSHYSVRGGEEPKAKGAKWGKGKKKLDKYTNPRTGKRDHVQGKTQKDLNEALKKEGLVLDAAYQDAEQEEKVLMYDNDGNVYTGTFNKYMDGGREITGIERDTKAEKVQTGQVEGKLKDKYANRDWNKDVEDSKRYGYSEQTETGKKPVTKAEEAQANSKATPESYAQSKGKSIRDIAQEVNNNDAARAQANQLMKDGRTYEEAAALAHSDMERGVLKGQESSTPTEPYAKSDNKYLGQSVKDLNKLDVRNLNDSELSQLREHASASSRTGARGADKLWKNVDTEINRRAMEKESSTPKTNKTDAYNDKVFADFKKNGKDYQRVPMEGYAGTANDFRAAAKRAGVEIEYDKGDDTFYLRKSTETSNAGSRYSTEAKKESKAGSRYKSDTKNFGMEPSAAELGNAYNDANKAKSKFAGMSVATLKSQYAKALGADRGAIYQLLKAKGYTYKDGKWIK